MKLPKTLLLFVLLLLLLPAALLAQESPTPTPDAEGVIYVEVQPNDSLWAIAARAGLTLQELLDLNELQETSVVQPGDLLIIGYGTPPPTPTSDAPTPTLAPPTPPSTAVPPRTAICLAAFDDTNRDGVHDGAEPLRAGVAFTVYNDQEVIANYITDGRSEPHCLEGLEAGTYYVTRSIGRDEVLTTEGEWALTLVRGSVLNQSFGSYLGSVAQATEAAAAQLEAEATAAAPSIEENPPSDAAFAPANAVWLVALIVLLLGGAVLILRIGFGRLRSNRNDAP